LLIGDQFAGREGNLPAFSFEEHEPDLRPAEVSRGILESVSTAGKCVRSIAKPRLRTRRRGEGRRQPPAGPLLTARSLSCGYQAETEGVCIRPGGKSDHSAGNQMRRASTEAFKRTIEKAPAYEFKAFKDLYEPRTHESASCG
jgi:hypothetical protein